MCEFIVDGHLVKAYADNDGGLWFYHPITGRAIYEDEIRNRNYKRVVSVQKKSTNGGYKGAGQDYIERLRSREEKYRDYYSG